MNTIDLDNVRQYVNENIVDFHKRRIKSLEDLTLGNLLKKNPYLFKAKNVETAGEMVSGLLEARLSSSEEKLFGDFLEHLAVFIASKTCNGHKSTAPGVDLEFFNKNIHYVVSIKSGTSWGNSSQQDKLEENLKKAVARVKQSQQGVNVQSVLGICYGKTKTSYLRGYLKVVGQNFWYLISENMKLYTDIIEPIGYKAKKHNLNFLREKNRVINRFTKSFIDKYCDAKGDINWEKIVEFNSKNYDLNTFIS
jgi:hypothetical protein